MTTRPQPAIEPARVVRGLHGAVASPHHLATGAGLATLRGGGSAVDAAIATNAALAVVYGHSCGVGGDAFWLIWDHDAGHALSLNGSGRAGRVATIEAARGAGHVQMPQRGPWSITVPGAVHSWGEAHARFGRLDWSTLFEIAIDLAEAFPASDRWSSIIEQAAIAFGTDGDWARTYRLHDRPWRPGDIVRLEALARTLRSIADEGASAAYGGSVGARTAAYFAERGVPIDAADLERHTSDWGEPVGIDYRGLHSLSHPPNSVGVVALQTLGILERFAPPAPGAFDGRGWSDAHWIHLGLEASRLALAERDAYVTDFASMPEGAVEAMLSDERLDELAARIEPDRVLPATPATLPAGGGTVYITAADRWGGVVSLLQSNFQGFGSGLVDNETGIAFQDRGAFFRLDAGHANALAPGKRPTHTLAPGLLLREGRPWIAHGAMGGEIQPQVFAQFVSAVVDGGADVATAVAAPRWAARMPAHLAPPTLTALESRFEADVLERLSAMGHELVVDEPWSSAMGHGHAIELLGADETQGRERSFAAAADPRSEGSAAAF